MRKNRKVIILVLILFISVGFAYLSTNLFISGTSIVKRTTWDVHFNNIQNESTTGTMDTNATISSDKKSVDFEVSFDAPGEEYSFNVDIVNNGNLDAMLESYEIVDSDYSYLEWEIVYDDGAPFSKYDLLGAGQTVTLFIKLRFIEDVEISNLPTDYDYQFGYKFIANYVQADSNAKDRISGTYTITYNLDGGTISNNPTTYTLRNNNVSIQNPTKEGYTFLGWIGGKNLYDDNLYASPYVEENVDGYVGLKMLASGNTIAYNQTRYECNKTYTISSRSDLQYSRYLVRIRKLDDSDWMNTTDFTPTNSLWTYNNYYKGWWINNSDLYGEETIQIPEGLYWELGLGFQTQQDLIGTTQYIYDIMLEESSSMTNYEPYISTPTPDITISEGMLGNRTYTAVWQED